MAAQAYRASGSRQGSSDLGLEARAILEREDKGKVGGGGRSFGPLARRQLAIQDQHQHRIAASHAPTPCPAGICMQRATG